MLQFMLLSLVSLTTAAPQYYNFHHRQARQPHLEYGPAPLTAPMSNFLTDLQTVMDIQTNNLEPQSFFGNSIEEYTQSYPQMPFLTPTQATYTSPPTPLEFTRPQSQENQQNQPPTPIISKRFFLHSAPEDDDESLPQQKHIIVGKPRKNFNVVFIRAPSKSNQRAALKITPALNEERTVIYVLAKKHDATEIDAQVHEPVTPTVKPEVYFIKYKTNEEAEHAQQAIQAQYDELGGSTQVTNEGVAPVSSVIGALDAQQQGVAAPSELPTENALNSFNTQLQSFPIQQSAQLAAISNENNGYLPPELRI